MQATKLAALEAQIAQLMTTPHGMTTDGGVNPLLTPKGATIEPGAGVPGNSTQPENQRGVPTSSSSPAAAQTSTQLSYAPPAAKTAPAPSLSPPTLDADTDAAEVAEAEANQLLDELDEIGVPPTGEGISALFKGSPLPLPFVPAYTDIYGNRRKGNPYIRSEPFQYQTCHYRPAQAGDSMQGELVRDFEALGYPIYSYELRSLVPTLSYLFDLKDKLRQTANLLAEALAAGSLPPSLAEVPQDLVNCTIQADSIYEFQGQRLAVLRKIAEGNDSDLAILAKIYKREAEVTGGRSRLEQGIDDLVATREVNAMISINARAKAQSAFTRPTPPPPPPGTHGGQRTFRQRRAAKPAGPPRPGAAAQAQAPARPATTPSQAPTAFTPRPQTPASSSAAATTDGGAGKGGGKGATPHSGRGRGRG